VINVIIVKNNKMALRGDITYTHVDTHESELEEIIITDPDGNETTKEVPKQVITIKDYNDVYLWIKQIDIQNVFHHEEKIEAVHYHYAGYSSKEDRTNNQEEFLFWNMRTLENHNHDLNLWEQCYNDLKSSEPFTNLENC